jgi:transposase
MAARPILIVGEESQLSKMACLSVQVILGVDTHRDTHAVALIDLVGRLVATDTFATTRRGIAALIGWAQQHGTIRRAGVEGTGSYGASLTRALALEGVEVIEVTRTARVGARHCAKNDTRDAQGAARSVLSGQATAIPKSRDGIVESIRVLRNTRASAVKARSQAILQLKSLVLTAPDELRESLRDLNTKALVERCARMHRARQLDTLHATRHALRTLARRHNALTDEIAQLDALLADLTAKAAPRLLTQTGIGPQIAARLLLVAGDNPTRLRNDAALAALCGASPVEASSGKTIRHRLNRGGDRQANSALWLIATNRMIHDPTTRAYVNKKTSDGKSTKEIRRCLMRHIARGIFALLIADLHDARTLHTQPSRAWPRATARAAQPQSPQSAQRSRAVQGSPPGPSNASRAAVSLDSPGAAQLSATRRHAPRPPRPTPRRPLTPTT